MVFFEKKNISELDLIYIQRNILETSGFENKSKQAERRIFNISEFIMAPMRKRKTIIRINMWNS